jgi:hypothetical protein
MFLLGITSCIFFQLNYIIAATEAAIHNNSKVNINVYFTAVGCAGISRPYAYVCKKFENVRPGSTVSHKWMAGKSKLAVHIIDDRNEEWETRSINKGKKQDLYFNDNETTKNGITYKGDFYKPKKIHTTTVVNDSPDKITVLFLARGCVGTLPEYTLGEICKKEENVNPGSSVTYAWKPGQSGYDVVVIDSKKKGWNKGDSDIKDKMFFREGEDNGGDFHIFW